MDDPNMHAYGDHYQDTVADILRDVCELEPANPDLPDTVCVSVEDLKLIIDRHIEARRQAIEAALRDAPQAEPKRCPYCDDTGDVHSIDGEWRGTCECPAGATPHTEAVQPDRSEKIPLLIPSNPGKLPTEAVRMSEAEIDDLPLPKEPDYDDKIKFDRAVEQATAARLGVKMGDV